MPLDNARPFAYTTNCCVGAKLTKCAWWKFQTGWNGEPMMWCLQLSIGKFCVRFNYQSPIKFTNTQSTRIPSIIIFISSSALFLAPWLNYAIFGKVMMEGLQFTKNWLPKKQRLFLGDCSTIVRIVTNTRYTISHSFAAVATPIVITTTT